jgi:hypothetical protein
VSYKPTIQGQPRTRALYLRVTDTELHEIHARATALNLTASDLLRRLLGMPTANVSQERRAAARARLKPKRQPAKGAASPTAQAPASGPPAASQPPQGKGGGMPWLPQ